MAEVLIDSLASLLDSPPPNPDATLNGAINASVTSLIINSPLPANVTTAQYRIRIDAEWMTVTAIGGTGNRTWTVARGVAGSTAATHATGASVYIVVLAESITQYVADTAYLSATSRSANTVLAAPNGAPGAATFRTLVAADIPATLAASTFPGITLASTTSPFTLNASVGTAGQVLTSAGAGATPTWTTPTVGTVTSVALTVPGVLFSVAGSPITTNGTLALSLLTQTANRVLAGPTSGGVATPTFRALVTADLPTVLPTLTGALLFTDNSYDIGASGATRPKTGWFGTSIVVPFISAASATPGTAALVLTSNGSQYGKISATNDAGGGAWSLGFGAAPTNAVGTAVLKWTGLGNLSLGLASLGQAATDGFPFVPIIATNPSGTPTGMTGFVPMAYDTTAHKLWIFDSGWKSAVFA